MNEGPQLSGFDIAVFGQSPGRVLAYRRAITEGKAVVALGPDEPHQEGEFFALYEWDAANNAWAWRADSLDEEVIRSLAITAAGTSAPFQA